MFFAFFFFILPFVIIAVNCQDNIAESYASEINIGEFMHF